MSRSDGGRWMLQREVQCSEPVTDHRSKKVMLRAERDDVITITDIITRLKPADLIPTEATVVRRTNPYYGPKLLLSDDENNYLLTAPGPDTQLLLWGPNQTKDGGRSGWYKLAEVTAMFADQQPQYDLCPECGKPMQTLEHERKSAVGACLTAELEDE